MEYSPPGRGGPGPPYSNSQTYERKTIRSPTDSSDSRRQEMGVGDDSMSPSSPSPSMISSSSTQSNDPSHSTSASTGKAELTFQTYKVELQNYYQFITFLVLMQLLNKGSS